MTISRWKVMAGILGVSLGGLAAIAGQCPKSGDHKTQRSDDRVDGVKVVPPAGSGRAASTAPFELPPLPGTTPTTPETLKLPDVPPPPVSSPMPASPRPQTPPQPVVEVKAPPMTPPTAPVVPVSGTAPQLPAMPPSATPVEFVKPAAQPMTPPPVVSGPELAAPVVSSPATPSAVVVQPVVNVAPSASPPVPVPAAVATTTKFRIILRVGEGEPMFEVRSGDDLVMKVICEKVDIKSPERGQTLSAVTASGRVRFVGFGSEGSCDTLSFLAGTGEVAMSGNVKIQVKDKLGRVESELTTESIKYRIDTSVLPGSLKP